MILFSDSQATLHNKVRKVSIRNSWFPPLHTTYRGKLPVFLNKYTFVIQIYIYTVVDMKCGKKKSGRTLFYRPAAGGFSSKYFSVVPLKHLNLSRPLINH